MESKWAGAEWVDDGDCQAAQGGELIDQSWC